MPTNPSPRNPYQPTPMRVLRAYYESTDRSLKTLELSFENQADRVAFFQKFNPGQFCQLSVFGKGESPLGVASAVWEGDFVRFTIQRMGSVTKALHNLKPGDTLGMRGPLGNGFPSRIGRGRIWSSLAAVARFQHCTRSPSTSNIQKTGRTSPSWWLFTARAVPACACTSTISKAGISAMTWKSIRQLMSRRKPGIITSAMCRMWSNKLLPRR